MQCFADAAVSVRLRPIAGTRGCATLMSMHVIGNDNHEEAADAIRDILMMYVDMAASYSGFGHAVDVHIRFDPLRFVDAQVDGNACLDLDLLRAGSAIAILCQFYDLWSEENPLAGHPRTERFELAVHQGRLRAIRDVEAVILEAISRNEMSLEDPWFEEAVAPIYRKYVLGLFQRLSECDRD